MDFGPTNPFYVPSTLPYQAPPFDQIKDSDYQPAIEAGMEEQRREVRAIADNPAPPTFENTFVAMEKSGRNCKRSRTSKLQNWLLTTTRYFSTPNCSNASLPYTSNVIR